MTSNTRAFAGEFMYMCDRAYRLGDTFCNIQVCCYGVQYMFRWRADSLDITLASDSYSAAAVDRAKDIFRKTEREYLEKMKREKFSIVLYELKETEYIRQTERAEKERNRDAFDLCVMQLNSGKYVFRVCRDVERAFELVKQYPHLGNVVYSDVTDLIHDSDCYIGNRHLGKVEVIHEYADSSFSSESAYTTDSNSNDLASVGSGSHGDPWDGYDTMSDFFSDSDVASDLEYEDQANEVELGVTYKESCKKKFKIRDAAGKKKVDKFVKQAKSMTKNEKKKLIAAIGKLETHADVVDFSTLNGDVDRTIETGSEDISPLRQYFSEHPKFFKILLELVRISTGVYISTTSTQINHLFFFSGMTLGYEFSAEIKQYMSSLFSTYETQAGEGWTGTIKKTLDLWKDCDLLNSIKKCIIIFVSLSIDKLGFVRDSLPNIFSLVGDFKVLNLSAFDIMSYAMNVVLYLFDRLGKAWEQRSLGPLFAAAPKISHIADEYDAIVAIHPHIMAGKVDELTDGRATFNDYSCRLNLFHNKLKTIANTCDKRDAVLINAWKHKISILNFEVESKFAERSVRECPVSIVLAGSSGVGKTVLVPLIAKVVAQVHGRTLVESDFFFRNPSDDYWSGYCGQFVLVEDEKNAMIASASTVNENKVTLDVVNNSIMHLNMADLPSKGIFTMRSLIHIITTNKLDAQASLNCNEPAAVMRRSLQITVEVKPEFCKPGSTMLDPSKCAYNPIADDAWLFTVLEVETVGHTDLSRSSGYVFKVVFDESGKAMSRVPTHELLVFLRQHTKRHILCQKRLLDNFKSLFDIKLCDHGSGKEICRECNPELPQYEIQRNLVNTGIQIMNQKDVKDSLPRGPIVRELQLQAGMIPIIIASATSGYFIKFAKDANFGTSWFGYACMGLRMCFWQTVLFILGCFPKLGRYSWDSLFLSGVRSVKEAIMNPYLRGAGRDALYDWKPWAFVVLSGAYYSLFPFIASFTIGNYFFTSIFVGDAVSAWVNRCAHQFYRVVLADGASKGLKRWAALKMKPFFDSKYSYTGIVAAVTGALALYKLMHVGRKNMVEQGSAQSNIWSKPYNPRVVCDEVRVTTRSSDLIASMSKRVTYMHVYMDKATKGIPFNIIPLKDGAWLVPYHAFYTREGVWKGFQFMDLRYNNADSGANVGRVPIDRKLIVRVKNKDLAVLYILQTAGHMKDMTKFLTDVHGDCSATYVYRDVSGQLLIEKDNTTRMVFKDSEQYPGTMVYCCEAPFPTFVGLCGAPQITNTKQPSIASIHIAGVTDTKIAECLPIYKSEVMETLSLVFKDMMTVQTGSFEEMDLTDGNPDMKIVQERHFKSSLNFVENGSFQYFGSIPARAKSKSSIINTEMSEVVEEVFEKQNIYGNPSFLRSWRPWFKGANAVTHAYFKTPELIRVAADDYFKPIMARLKTKDLSSVTPLDNLTVLSGEDGHPFYKHIDIKTSSGHPFKFKKSKFIEATYHPDDVDHQWHFVMNEWAEGRVANLVERALKGYRLNCVYSACLKVEAKKLFEEIDGVMVPKISMPRIFYGASFELIFMMRKLFMPLVDLLQRCEESEISVGINATGPDWGNMARKLLRTSNCMMAADQEKFDQSVTPEELAPIYNFFIDLAKLCNYSEQDILVMKALAGCVIFPIIDFDSDLVSFYTLHASGGFATVQINCIVNSMRHRMLYYSPEFRSKVQKGDDKLYKQIVKSDFRKFATPEFFGDDSLVAVRERFSKYYNLHSFAKFMATQGVNVTTAQKGEIVEGTQKLEDSDYLKRGFRFDDEREEYAAPLNEGSIMKRLFVLDPSKVLTHKEQCGEAIASSLRDYFQFGREVFDKRRKQLMEVSNRCGLDSYVNGGFMTYDSYLEEFKDKYIRTIPQPCGM